MSSFLRASGLTKSYLSGEDWLVVLEDLDLQVEQGEAVAVVGESGSGKSTLLHLLGGMDRPDRGQVSIDSQSLFDFGRRQLAEFRNRYLGFVFQFHHLLPEFTALENVAFPELIRRRSRREALERARKCLEEVGLGQRAWHRPGELSGGEQQRVALARALAGEPQLLMADEPTGNLDPRTAASIEQLILEVHRRRGMTTLVVTHNPRLAASCDRVVRLENRRLQAL